MKLKDITPPILYAGAKKMRSLLPGKNKGVKNPALEIHAIKAGPLAGYKLYGDIKAEWFADMVNGTYDKEIFAKMENPAMQKEISGGTIVEIGAHVGYHTLAFAHEIGASGHVFAFEPNPFNLERLQKNISENGNNKMGAHKGLDKRITILEMAVSDKDGSEEFVFGSRVDKGSSSGSFLDRAHTIWEKSVYESEKIGYKRMKVATRTLDSLRKDRTIPHRISLCKIDVEGAEYLVLGGMKHMLKTDRPLVLIEIHSIFNMWKAQEIFSAENYSLELLKEEADGRCFFAAHPLASAF